ncbi:MAG TPA: glyoxalase/bleomycin resistance/extradiol dioxygenase family protein [Ignavibacteria bacterium]|nr:glyoxalase/bleomycin resistance/extradiol dioxygenase family protein [Ignavibacteria bacterium]HMQ98813.1 glyoxalase/bleomycin resistance/extradiol dioxygenase family protein [Ignavibacteria bacterium]
MAKQIFINLPVKDLKRSMDFFAKLGFTFNPQFTDENAACMIIGENIFAMLLVESFFKTFTRKDIADASKTTEILTCISVGSRDEVNKMVDAAVADGGVEYSEAADHGWMYYRVFEDPDKHQWEIMFGDESQITENK